MENRLNVATGSALIDHSLNWSWPVDGNGSVRAVASLCQ